MKCPKMEQMSHVYDLGTVREAKHPSAARGTQERIHDHLRCPLPVRSQALLPTPVSPLSRLPAA